MIAKVSKGTEEYDIDQVLPIVLAKVSKGTEEYDIDQVLPIVLAKVSKGTDICGSWPETIRNIRILYTIISENTI